MIENSFNRRGFLKVLGWGGATVALSGCGNTSVEDGKEFVTSYVQTADYIIPSIGTYFNSTCAQCDAGCGIMGRVREGRVLKLEGNPKSSINNGKMCGLGQAGVQAHYNPDRIREPLLRNGDKGEAITWEKALGLINEKVGGVKAENIAFLTGGISGHVKALLKNYLDALGSGHHYVYEAVAPSIMRAANKKAYGTEMPRLRLDKAKVIVSFGADFLGAWISPVHFSQQYARFRKADNGERGVLVQVESKMTLTGANADRWLAIRPGTEGILALGLINALAAAGLSVPEDVAAVVREYTTDRVSKDTGVSTEHIGRLVALLKERSPSLVIAGSAAEGYAHGSQNATAIALLNQVLGNVGKTVEAPSSIPFPQMAPATGNRFALQSLNDNMAQDKVKVLFSYGVNPVFTAPASMKLKENLKKVPFKVVFAHYMDETALEADLVLPLNSALEDWATVMPEYVAEGAQLNIQQPLMEKLYPGTLGVGDILLALLKQRRPDEYKGYEDFYSYLRSAMVSNKGALGGSATDDDTFWDATLSHGVVKLAGTPVNMSGNPSAKGLVVPGPFTEDSAYPFHLIPAVSASLRDGRNANEPWLQESPDPLTTIVWDSWVEMHPKTAAKLGVVEGDIVEVASKSGAIKAQVYVFTGIHPDVISVPLGNGHEALGRYAKGVGVNAFKILDSVFDKETGELAMHETRVKVSKAGQRVVIVKDEGPAGGNQMGRKIAVRMSSNKVNLSEEV
ncbi:MAG: prokaryotic molybdopterin-containing oxidoreductase family, iron-sulfur binding subunit [Candidatus Nitrotoga sp. MKT]|nr:MAG: prokaryotic molybdopterin-containing oxidoreductase family, iron-sulfur binding subunit [Candidatus Nitrotoga sp. MKT]